MQIHCGTWVVARDNDIGICLGLVEEIQLHKLVSKKMTMTIYYLLTCLPCSHRKGSWPLNHLRACSQRSARDHGLNAVVKVISSISITISFECKALIEFCWWSAPFISLTRKKHRIREIDKGFCQF